MHCCSESAVDLAKFLLLYVPRNVSELCGALGWSITAKLLSVHASGKGIGCDPLLQTLFELGHQLTRFAEIGMHLA